MPYNSSLCTEDQPTQAISVIYGLEQWEEAIDAGTGPSTDKGPTEIKGPGGESPDYLMTSGQLFVSSYSWGEFESGK